MLARSPDYSPTILSGQQRFSGPRDIIKDPEFGGGPLLPGIYRLLFLDDGVLKVVCAGERLDVKPATLLFLQPGDLSDLEASPGARGIILSFIVKNCAVKPSGKRGFSPMDPKEFQPRAKAVWDCDIPRILPEKLADQILDDLRHAVTIWWQDDWNHFKANGLLAHILMRIVNHYTSLDNPEPSQAQNTTSWVTNIQHVIDTRLSSLQTTADMAAMVGLSPDHFAKAFKEEVGERPAAYLRRRRLERAIDLVRDTQRPIAEVAVMVGYRHATALCQAWKTRFDRSPLQWRKLNKG